MNLVCDICGDMIQLDNEYKCNKCEIVWCESCVDRCKECGNIICCNVGVFKTDLCIECERDLYLEIIEERLSRCNLI